MKKITLIGLLIWSSLTAWSGQDPLYTQFMTNPYLINPALTGTYPYYQIIANNRIQWLGMTDAPITNTLSMYGPFKSQPMGVGGFIMSDIVGPESKLSINATYAYNYAIGEDLKISMGLMLGMLQYKIDGSRLRAEEYDPFFTPGETYSQIKPDGTVGVYVYSSTYNGGISVTNLFGNKLEFGSPAPDDTNTYDRNLVSRLSQHFYIHGGYKYYVNRDIAVEPTLILRKVTATPLNVDFNVRGWYGQRAWDGTKLWAGVGYRHKDAVSILVGVLYQRKIEFGYTYDIGINNLNPYHSGSHEIMINFRFNNFQEL